jgi:hypothetical protein
MKLFPARESLESDILAGNGKTADLFLQCTDRVIRKNSSQFVRPELGSCRVAAGPDYCTVYIHDSDSGVVLIRCAGLGAAPPREG